MDAFTRANDYKTKSMEKVLSPGLMEGNIKECIKMMKSKDMEFLNGLMEGYIKVSGQMGNNMEMAPTRAAKASKDKATGKMERESDGKKSKINNRTKVDFY